MTITHPSMKKTAGPAIISNKPNIQQNYVVDDPTQDIDKHLEQFGAPQSLDERPLMPTNRVLEKAKEAQVVKPPLNPKDEEDKKKLESILFLGRLTKVVELAGSKFEISTLTNREQNDIVRELYGFTEGSELFIIRTLTLANALKSINGIKLDQVDVFSEEEEKEFTSKFRRRMAIIDNMQLAVVEKLYIEYNKLLEENAALFAGNAIKK